MPITHQDLFRKVAEIRKQFRIPTKICHLTYSEEIRKADEVFWEFKCENNLDHPLRYSEMHRLLSVSKGIKRAALINLDVSVFEEYDLVPVFLYRDLVFRRWTVESTSIFHNYACDTSKSFSVTLSALHKKITQGEVKNIVGTVLRDWIVEVPLHKALLIAQASNDFSDIYDCDMGNFLTECYNTLKEVSEKHAKMFKKDVKENYYGSKKKVFRNEKTRSQKINRGS